MLLTITTTHRPATDLGYLLHKNPGRMHDVELTFGGARVFYPEAAGDRCTAALLLDVDPVALTRRKADDAALEPYVNDRPYVVSSFMSVAISRVFGTALGGRSKERPELAEQPIPLVAEMPAVPSRGGPGLLERLFGPLGYAVEARRHTLDPDFPSWGESPYYAVTLRAECRLYELLRHLYVILPVLDDRKHYWVGKAEVEKLLKRGQGWLAEHPERDVIVERYLERRRPLTRLALQRLTDGDEDQQVSRRDREESDLEKPLRLHRVRHDAVRDELVRLEARRVLDLGCGDGQLLKQLLRSRQFERLVGLDASVRMLETAFRRLRLADAPPSTRERVELLHGALTYRDARLEGYDAAVLVEVIEHLDVARLGAMERVVFEHARPKAVIVTTPNVEYNVKFETLPAGRFRHRDHRFEWTRDELRGWADDVARRFGYSARCAGIGEPDPELGSPSQMAVFERRTEP